jgi:type 1 fimbriae regulatory protein FimB/type 1 fimbriae regulatory protein FimE
MSEVNELAASGDQAPPAVNGKVPPRRRPNAQVRGREYLLPDEVERLVAAARKAGRYGQRDAALILITYRHGLRVSELCNLRWDQVDLPSARIAIRRLKGGLEGGHPIGGRELRALRAQGHSVVWVFANERGGPMTPAGVRKIVARAGRDAGLELAVHPHMLRHGCGYALANKGIPTRTIQEYLGHRSIASTAIYTALAERQFVGLWED